MKVLLLFYLFNLDYYLLRVTQRFRGLNTAVTAVVSLTGMSTEGREIQALTPFVLVTTPRLAPFLQVWDHIATRVKFCDTGVEMEVCRILRLALSMWGGEGEACATYTCCGVYDMVDAVQLERFQIRVRAWIATPCQLPEHQSNGAIAVFRSPTYVVLPTSLLGLGTRTHTPPQVFREESLRQGSSEERARFLDLATKADVFVGSAIQEPSTAEWVAEAVEEAGVGTRFSAGCPPELARASLLGGFRPDPPAPAFVRILPDFLRDLLGGENSGTKKDRVLWDTLNGFYERISSEDLTFLSLVLVDS